MLCKRLNALPTWRESRGALTLSGSQWMLIDSVLREVLADSGHSHEASRPAAAQKFPISDQKQFSRRASSETKNLSADLRR